VRQGKERRCKAWIGSHGVLSFGEELVRSGSRGWEGQVWVLKILYKELFMAKEITLKTLDIQRLSFKIVGDSPLIMNRFDEKAKREMLEKQQKKAKGAKEIRDPEAEVQKSLYFLPNDQVAFPADAVKLSMIRGAKSLGMVMSDARGAFFVEGIYSEKDGRDLIPVEGVVQAREDVVKIGMGTSMLRYRGQVANWSMTINIRFNASVISAEQLASMLSAAGFGCGIGEWRPERDGSFGMFHIDTN